MTDAHLTQHHRDTLAQIERHPTSHNIEWHDVVALLNEIADVREEHDGTFVVENLGEVRLFLHKPPHKDIDEQMVMDLRAALTQAGYLPTA